ncbi:MAG TPA: VOC family protein, partial [Candidatus Binataceae bacterium]|nr:VOC family protein [Candidatus Binataceae bacterium]
SRATPAIAPQKKASYIPTGFHSANACLVVHDAPRAIEFYKQAFGATELMRLDDPSGNIIHAQIKIGDSPIDIAPEYPPHNRSPQSLGGSSVPIGLYVEDVDAFAAKAIAAGAKVIFPIADQFYGDRGGRLQDPFGHMWIVSTHREDMAPQEMTRRAAEWMKEMESTASPEKPAGAPEGYHSITPYLQVKGAARFIEFLKEAFGAEEIFRVPRGDEIAHAQLRIEGSMIEVADAIDKYQPNPTAVWLHVKDTDATYARALKAGASSLHEPMVQDYGERSASVKDPFDNYWYIATHDADAEPVPEELHSITPYLHPKSAPPVIDFLKRAFDAEEVERHQDPQGTVHHAKIRVGDSIIAMGEAHGPYQPMPPALHLYVPDTDATYQRALAAGAISIDEPVDAGYGDRYAGVKDPFGNVWYIATHLRDVTVPAEPPNAEIEPRQRPGSIMPFMFNDDPQAAFELYRKIFGAREVHRVTQPNGKPSHIQMAIGETHVMLDDATAPHAAEYRARGFAGTPRDFGGTPLHLYIYVADADAAFKRALDSGSKVVDAMADKEWGDRCGGVQDPFGHIWYIATPLKGPKH